MRALLAALTVFVLLAVPACRFTATVAVQLDGTAVVTGEIETVDERFPNSLPPPAPATPEDTP
jgi:hypothetical protein